MKEAVKGLKTLNSPTETENQARARSHQKPLTGGWLCAVRGLPKSLTASLRQPPCWLPQVSSTLSGFHSADTSSITSFFIFPTTCDDIPILFTPPTHSVTDMTTRGSAPCDTEWDVT